MLKVGRQREKRKGAGKGKNLFWALVMRQQSYNNCNKSRRLIAKCTQQCSNRKVANYVIIDECSAVQSSAENIEFITAFSGLSSLFPTFPTLPFGAQKSLLCCQLSAVVPPKSLRRRPWSHLILFALLTFVRIDANFHFHFLSVFSVCVSLI